MDYFRKCVINNNRGQSMVELAFILPVVILLLAGTMEFGRVLHEFIVVTAAAREGVRSAAVGNSDSTVEAAVKAAAASIDRGQLDVDIAPPVRTRGNAVTVTVSSSVQIITPVISSLFPQNPFPVTGRAVMRVE